MRKLEYSIKEIADLAGISTRTLRYYDKIGLLHPCSLNSSGYRIYGKNEIDRLQQILFYKELGFDLKTIEAIIDSPLFNHLEALKQHLNVLIQEKRKVNLLIKTLEKTIACEEGKITMNDYEKFEGFKKNQIAKNEELYGNEIRNKYGNSTIDKSNQQFMNMTPEVYKDSEEIAEQINSLLETAVKNDDDPNGEKGKRVSELHRQWIQYFWTEYSKDAHRELVEMYVADERFKNYYDKNIPGCAVFLRDAVKHWI